MTLALEHLHAHRREILELASKYGATNVRVFGSVARGDACPGSDVDILVTFAAGRDYFDQGGLHVELAQLLGCDVDVVNEPELREAIRQQVLDQAIAI